MAGEAIFECTSVSHNNVPLVYATHVRLLPAPTFKVDQGPAGSPGPVKAAVVHRRFAVEVYGLDHAELLALIGVKGSTVIGILGPAGAAQQITITNVRMTDPLGPIEVPDKDGGGKLLPFGVRGDVCFGANDTFVTVCTVG
jgi:hypothetical protein